MRRTQKEGANLVESGWVSWKNTGHGAGFTFFSNDFFPLLPLWQSPVLCLLCPGSPEFSTTYWSAPYTFFKGLSMSAIFHPPFQHTWLPQGSPAGCGGASCRESLVSDGQWLTSLCRPWRASESTPVSGSCSVVALPSEFQKQEITRWQPRLQPQLLSAGPEFPILQQWDTFWMVVKLRLFEGRVRTKLWMREAGTGRQGQGPRGLAYYTGNFRPQDKDCSKVKKELALCGPQVRRIEFNRHNEMIPNPGCTD